MRTTTTKHGGPTTHRPHDRGPTSRETAGAIGVLDIGTSKIACLIATVEPRGPDHGGVPKARVLGVGYQRSRGVKAGVITDLDEAEEAVRAAVGQAERMAGLNLGSVLVAVSCGRLKSRTYTANGDVETGVVGDGDIQRVMEGGRAYAERDGRTLVHLNRLGFRLDRAAQVNDPRGMAAHTLSADLHAVTADDAPVRNLMMAVERCHLAVGGLVAAPYASGLAATTDDERRLGVTCIDIGGGAATLAAFADGHLIYADAIPVGGNHLTFDIARALQTPVAEAERIKALYGTLVEANSDEHESFAYPLTGEDEGSSNRATRAQLRNIIQPRVSGLLALIAERLDRSGIRGDAVSRLVLTGGTSQLVGLANVAASTLGRRVRVAGVPQVAGLPGGVAKPAFAVAVGLLVSAARPATRSVAFMDRSGSDSGYLERVGNWLREGF